MSYSYNTFIARRQKTLKGYIIFGVPKLLIIAGGKKLSEWALNDLDSEGEMFTEEVNPSEIDLDSDSE